MNIRTLLIFLLISNLALGQMKQGVFVFGPKVGLQANTLKFVTGPSGTSAKLNIQYQAGIFTRINMGRFSIQPEGIYQTKGATFKDPSEKHTYHYISTPVLVGFAPLKGLHLEVGPEYSWALNAGWKKDGITQFGPDLKIDKAIVTGLRIDMLDMLSMLSLNLRYTHGLVNTTERTSSEVPLDFRTRSFQVSVTYNFSEYYKWWRKYGIKTKKK